MRPLLFDLGSAAGLADGLCRQVDMERGALERRRFPDGESYVRLATPVAGRDVVLLCSLDDPDSKSLPLLFAADAARDQEARSIGLVAPYLAYMRQDRAFNPGEAVSSRSFARLLSQSFDWLATVDPHLHRYANLAAVYRIPAIAASASAPIAAWVRSNVASPFLVGPDSESAQWVQRIAVQAGAAYAVLDKRRHGDRSVEIKAGEADLPAGSTPVIVDDIASSATTLIETVRLLRERGWPPPVCIVVHALFAGDAWQRLAETGPALVVSTNSVAHASNRIDMTAPLSKAVTQALARPPR
jgi:ribose-phosphate pyrophosphokinase